MPLVSSSPNSPVRRRRHPSSIDLSASSYAANGYGQSPPDSPQTLRSIPQSPVTPRQPGFGAFERLERFSGDFTADAGGGLGSLADELANAWDDDGEGEDGVSGANDDDDVSSMGQQYGGNDDEYVESVHDFGIGGSAGVSDDDSGVEGGKPRAPRQKIKSNHQSHRRHESLYDGSDYGNDSDFEDPGDLPPGLEARMAGIDSLVRSSQAGDDELIDRFIRRLRDLGGQAGIENNTSRLITAHSSLTSHLTHQTRTVQTLAHSLLFSPLPALSTDDIDDLIPLIDNILPNLPFPVPQNQSNQEHGQPDVPSANPLGSLQSLLTQTSDFTLALRTLSDTLHESRQLTTTASRRLKSVREVVAEIRRDEEAREEGTRWIEKGEWDRRLGEREAGKVCKDVVSGFEAFCGEWRARLFGSEVSVA
ncbi:hypothetical protein VTO42DRAFT_382 [Malbranchea cinnamomea]